jgi:parallel beta-helix repeat protein
MGKGSLRTSIAGLLTVALMGGTMGGAQPAGAGEPRKLHVRPGPGAIQRAIDRARPGDILLVHRGRYRESPIVSKPLTIRGVGPRRPVIDGGCEGLSTIDVRANRVTLRRLKVIGAAADPGGAPFTGFEVDIVFKRNVEVRKLVLRDTCGDADYGINVYGGGRIVLAGNRATGFFDAGIYVGSISDGPILVENNRTPGNNRGILIEESAPGTVVVRGNTSNGNSLAGESATPTGIALADADGIVVRANVTRGNGDYGIHLSEHLGSGSDDNRLFDNVASGNGVSDFQNDGNGNCGSGNSFSIPPCA